MPARWSFTLRYDLVCKVYYLRLSLAQDIRCALQVNLLRIFWILPKCFSKVQWETAQQGGLCFNGCWEYIYLNMVQFVSVYQYECLALIFIGATHCQELCYTTLAVRDWSFPRLLHFEKDHHDLTSEATCCHDWIPTGRSTFVMDKRCPVWFTFGRERWGFYTFYLKTVILQCESVFSQCVSIT